METKILKTFLYSNASDMSYIIKVLDDDFQVAGSVIIYPLFDDDKNTRMTLLKVDKKYQGMGVGTKLIKGAIKFAEQFKKPLVLVASQLGKKAPMTTEQLAEMYKKHGFVEYDRDDLNIKMKYTYEN